MIPELCVYAREKNANYPTVSAFFTRDEEIILTHMWRLEMLGRIRVRVRFSDGGMQWAPATEGNLRVAGKGS
jgi:hypothetical protein